MRFLGFSPLVTLLGLILILAFPPNNGHAQVATPTSDTSDEVVAFEIYPEGKILGDFFDVSIESGTTAEMTVVLANSGNVVFKGRTYAINAFTDVNGGFAVAEAGTPPAGPTTWIDYPEEVYTIDPGEGVERTFTVTVPDGTEDGEYISSLILQNAESLPIEGTENFDQVVRFAVPILITVPGPEKPSFDIGDISLVANGSASRIEVGIVNTGNVRVRPAGTVVISDTAGRQLYSAPVSMGPVFAGDSTVLSVPLSEILGPGEYEIEVALDDAEKNVASTANETVAAMATATPAPPAPIQIVGASGTPRPSADDVQFLDIAVSIENLSEPMSNAQLTLRVTKDGQEIENYPISSSLNIAAGPTAIQERYIPAEGWSTGNWEFTLSLESVDPGTGVARVLATAELEPVVVP